MKLGLKSAAKLWSYHLIMLLLCLIFVGGISLTWLSLVLNGLLLVGMILMAFNEGAYQGEKACTAVATIEKQMKEGRRVDDKLKEQVYSKKVAAWILIFGAAPFLLVSTVNAIVAPHYPEVNPQAVIEAEDTVGDFAFDANAEDDAVDEVNIVNIVTRAVFMPYVSVYSLVRGNVLNALFFLFSFPLPAAACVGYLCGPKLRMKKLKDIALGKKRKMRNLKVNKKPRRPKAEV